MPYKGSPAVLTALRAGEIDLAFEILGPMLPQVSSRVVRALAVTSDTRNPALPQVPTVQQAGVTRLRRGVVERDCRARRHAFRGGGPAQPRRA